MDILMPNYSKGGYCFTLFTVKKLNCLWDTHLVSLSDSDFVVICYYSQGYYNKSWL